MYVRRSRATAATYAGARPKTCAERTPPRAPCVWPCAHPCACQGSWRAGSMSTAWVGPLHRSSGLGEVPPPHSPRVAAGPGGAGLPGRTMQGPSAGVCRPRPARVPPARHGLAGASVCSWRTRLLAAVHAPPPAIPTPLRRARFGRMASVARPLPGGEDAGICAPCAPAPSVRAGRGRTVRHRTPCEVCAPYAPPVRRYRGNIAARTRCSDSTYGRRTARRHTAGTPYLPAGPRPRPTNGPLRHGR